MKNPRLARADSDEGDAHRLGRDNRLWPLALLAGLLIFAGRTALVFYAGSPVPFHDQWIAEATHLLVHDARHTLTWHNFVIPNGDHLIVATRFTAWALYRLTGHWDMLAEMIVNNAIVATAFALLIGHILNLAREAVVALALLVLTVWLASPLFYGNCLWGFQSSIELLVLTAIVQIVATSAMRTLDWRWWLATSAAVVGFFSFGSALMAPLTCLGICALRRRDPNLTRTPFIGAIGVNLIMLGCGVFRVLQSPSLGGAGPDIGNVFHTLLHALSWPAMQASWFALLLWFPALVATAWLARTRSFTWLAVGGLAWWTALQIGGIAITRSAPAAALAPRYYDIFAVGVIANGGLALALLRAAATQRIWRAAAVLLLVSWCGGVGMKGWQFARSHTQLDIPTMRRIAEGQIDVVQHYYAGEGLAALEAAPFPVRPYPEADFLVPLLDDPTIKQALPGLLKRAPVAVPQKKPQLTEYPWPGEHGPPRAAWFWSGLALAGAAALAYLVVALQRKRGPVQPTHESV